MFCKIIAGEIPSHKVFENDHVFAFLDIGPVTKGHTLVIPKNHAENLTEGTKEDAVHLMEVVHEIAPMITERLGATAYNLGMNHGVDAGQDVFHTHIHLMPRYEGVERTFVKQEATQEELEEVAKLISLEA